MLPVKKAFIFKLKLILKKLTKKLSKYVNGISIPIAIIEPGIAYPREEILLKNKLQKISVNHVVRAPCSGTRYSTS